LGVLKSGSFFEVLTVVLFTGLIYALSMLIAMFVAYAIAVARSWEEFLAVWSNVKDFVVLGICTVMGFVYGLDKENPLHSLIIFAGLMLIPMLYAFRPGFYSAIMRWIPRALTASFACFLAVSSNYPGGVKTSLSDVTMVALGLGSAHFLLQFVSLPSPESTTKLLIVLSIAIVIGIALALHRKSGVGVATAFYGVVASAAVTQVLSVVYSNSIQSAKELLAIVSTALHSTLQHMLSVQSMYMMYLLGLATSAFSALALGIEIAKTRRPKTKRVKTLAHLPPHIHVPESAMPPPGFVKVRIAKDKDMYTIETVPALSWAPRIGNVTVLDFGKWLEWIKKNRLYVIPLPLRDCSPKCIDIWRYVPCSRIVVEPNYSIVEINEELHYMKIRRLSDGALFEFRDPIWFYLLLNLRDKTSLCKFIDLYKEIVQSLRIVPKRVDIEMQYINREHPILCTETRLINMYIA